VILGGQSRWAHRAGNQRGWKAHSSVLLLAGVLTASPASADDDPSDPFVEIHGFVSQGAFKTTSNNYLARDSVNGSLEFSEAGINFTKALGDDLRVGIQLFARDLGAIGDYKPQLDWYYLDYRVEDWLGLRAGRLKLPFGLYNETSDIDSARIPVLLPQSVYPTQNREYFLAQTGGELYGLLPLGAVGALDYRAYAGTIFIDVPSYSAIGATSVSIPYLYGGRILWRTPLTGLQTGVSAQRLRLDVHYTPSSEALVTFPMPLPTDFKGTVELKAPITLFVASIEYAGSDLLLSAEYLRQWSRIESSLPARFPNSEVTAEGFYAMASYHVTPWFAPGAYYALMYPNVDDRHGREAYQHDLALSVRYDLTEHWLLKLEGHYMSGTASLDPTLNDNTPRNQLTRDWGAFYLKTTAFF
jgi:hypothetical protein